MAFSNKLVKRAPKTIKVGFQYVDVTVTFKKDTEISFTGDYDNKNKFRIEIMNGDTRSTIISSREQLKALSSALGEYIFMADSVKRINDDEGYN